MNLTYQPFAENPELDRLRESIEPPHMQSSILAKVLTWALLGATFVAIARWSKLGR